ncbi:O-antigen ligase family protein [Xylanibacter oryzae]|uniref:O-antigen ligase family protein n=1 Tax=Xylanibacter oryzae TaxID=185293 RepID=UPI00056D0C11|nr:O-antigen ligase family protein [Xylanibacter oryzae]
MNKVNIVVQYIKDNGGRAAVLFLLFLIALYELYSGGLNSFAIICTLPLIPIFVYVGIKNKMTIFWTLFVFNYFVMYLNKIGYMPIPSSIPNEIFEILLIVIALIDAKDLHISNLNNVMLLALIVWGGFCCIEIFNDTCGLGINIGAWYTGARLMAFQLLYAFIICSLYISTPEKIIKFLRVFAILSIFAAFWAWKQKTFGFTTAEKAWLWGYAARTHVVNGIIRYFSVFSDAANFGCNMASSAVAFYIVGITSRIKKDKIFFIIAGAACTWAMFASGTRTAIFCMIIGFLVFIFLSKSVKIALPVTIVFGVFLFILAFTTIGGSNSMIRRMRSAFNRDDASKSVRDINKESMAKYVKDAPWGMGIGIFTENVPPFNKYKILSQTPPDSEYVFIWVHTGQIGITVFVITTILMFMGGCWTVFFRINNSSLRGIGAAFCCAFAAIHIGGYGNQILMQFPNVLIFYGGLSIVYILPSIEKDYQIFEDKRLKVQTEIKEEKARKKRESRV